MGAGEFLSVVAFISLFWATLFSFNLVLKRSKRLGRLYERTLATFGVTVALGHIKVFSTKFNRVLVRASGCSPRWQRKWFCMGALFGLLAMFLSLVVLSLALWQTLLGLATTAKPNKNSDSSTQLNQGSQQLTMLIPGLNVPSSQVGFPKYFDNQMFNYAWYIS